MSEHLREGSVTEALLVVKTGGAFLLTRRNDSARDEGSEMDEPNDGLSPLEGCVVGPIALAIAIYSFWCTVIAFKGGSMPITGWHLPGGLLYGLFWVFIIDPAVWTVGYWVLMAVIMPLTVALNLRKEGAKGTVVGLGVALSFVLLLYGAYQCRDRIGGLITGQPLTETPTPTPKVTPTPTAKVTPTVTATPRLNLSLSTYYDDKAGITMGYPKDWKVTTEPNLMADDSGGGSAYGTTFYTDNVSRLPQVVILFLKGQGVQASEGYEFLDAQLVKYWSTLISDQDETISDEKILRTWPHFTVDGRPAVATGCSMTLKDMGEFFWVVMLTATSEDLYYLIWAGSADERDQTTARFEAMIQTIRFLP